MRNKSARPVKRQKRKRKPSASPVKKRSVRPVKRKRRERRPSVRHRKKPKPRRRRTQNAPNSKKR